MLSAWIGCNAARRENRWHLVDHNTFNRRLHIIPSFLQFGHFQLEFVENGVVGLVDCGLILQDGDLLFFLLLLLETLYRAVAIETQQGTPGRDLRMKDLKKIS